MQQPKNLVLFFLLSFAVFVGWTALQNRIWPPPKKVPPPPRLRLPNDQLWGGVPASVAPVSAVPGIGVALPLVGQVAVVEWSAGDRQRWVQITPEPKPQPKPVAPEPPKVAAAPARKITLGDDRLFNLQVTFTNRGGAVEEVVLNKFEEATRFGLPAKPPERFQLVPDDPDEPSYVLYHYAEPSAKHPLDSLGKLDWSVGPVKNAPEDDPQEVVFTADVPGQDVRITKTFTLAKGDYHVGLVVRLERKGDGNSPLSFRYQMTSGHGLPIEGEWYTYTYRNAMIGLIDQARRVAYRDLQDSRKIGIEEGGDDVHSGDNKYIGYAGIASQFFASMTVVDNEQSRRNFLDWARPTVEGWPNTAKPFLDDITVRVNTVPVELQGGKPVEHRYLLYNGPVKVLLLGYLAGEKAVSPDLVHRYESTLYLNTLTDYHSPNAVSSFFSKIGWTGLIIACTNFMHWLLHWLNFLVPSGRFAGYGLCIILLTVMVRGTMFPLSRRQAAASARMQEKMAELAPEVRELEQRYRSDPMELQRAKNELYLRKGINPLTMMGSCWMVFLQMPIFMGLYYALQESIFFRLEPFLWMPNLAAPDMLIRWGENVPVVSGLLGPFLNILPIVAVSLMIVQQKMTMPPPTDEQQAMQQSMMKYMMIFMGYMFYKVAAGLCIYFIASSLWGLAERRLIKKNPAKTPATPAVAPAGSARGRNPAGPNRSAASTRGRSSRTVESNGDSLMDKLREWWSEVLKQASKK